MPIYIINPKNAGVKKGVGDQRKGLNIYYAMSQFFGVKPVITTQSAFTSQLINHDV